MTFFDDLLTGPEGELSLTAHEVNTMPMPDYNAVTAKLDYEQRIRPNLKVQVRDTPDGGLRFVWKERS